MTTLSTLPDNTPLITINYVINGQHVSQVVTAGEAKTYARHHRPGRDLTTAEAIQLVKELYFI